MNIAVALGGSMTTLDESPPEDMPLSKGQQFALDMAVDGKNMLICGPGGTGKSEIVRRIIRTLRMQLGRHVCVCGMTARAAVNIGGGTLHSFLGLGIAANIADMQACIQSYRVNQHALEPIRACQVLIVDEVSMMTGDHLDMMDQWLRQIRQRNEPFGGIQVIFCGDLLQLPPVMTRTQREQRSITNRLVFQSWIWGNSKLSMVSLSTVFRQDDQEFIAHLMRVRRGDVPPDTMDYFMSRVGAKLKHPTRLYARNDAVDARNNAELAALPGRAARFRALNWTGTPEDQALLRAGCPVRDVIDLKVGAPVLFTKNCPNLGFINGEFGTVTGLVGSLVLVQKRNGTKLSVAPVDWLLQAPDGEVLASMQQLPLRLAWALTIHRAQGMTLDEVEADVYDCFDTGQAYVALSRARTIGGLSLLRPFDAGDVLTDQEALAYTSIYGG